MKKFVSEFKEFISRGNVVDMAVGLVVGSAFTAIVNSLVNDLLMPAIGMLVGGLEFGDLKWVLSGSGETEVAIRYGSFLQCVVNFLIIAFAVFLMVKMINKLRRKKAKEAVPEAPAEPPKPSEEVLLLSEIRDLLKKEASADKAG